ncbi:MAG: hypothetical protein AMXMBFR81_07540 [Chthonomonas sp.]
MRTRNEFAEAVDLHPELRGRCRAGLRALAGSHSRLVEHAGATLSGSINLEGALNDNPDRASDRKWDYGIGFVRGSESIACWVEVHPANSGEVSVFIEKASALKSFLNEPPSARLKDLTSRAEVQTRYQWVRTGSDHLTTRDVRRLNHSGLFRPVRRAALR